MKKEKATFGMGCFWQPDLLFSKTKGVIETKVGYMGGKMKNPSYENVCSDETGHIEVVQVTFDPDKISYKKLLEIFWKNHNPITPNRQGPDVGSQYQAVIFYHKEIQKKEAEATLKNEQKKYKEKISTEIRKASTFYPAEEYHQKYLEKRGLKVCH